MNKYISLILFSIFFVACSNESDLDMNILPDGKYPITFSADNLIMPVSKSFDENGIAGVYMHDIDGVTIPLSENSNRQYVYSNSQLRAALDDYRRYWSRADQEVLVTAYYPYNSTMSGSTFEINDLSNQDSPTNYDNFDILHVSSSVRFSERKTTVLAFDHLMSRIVINLTGSNLANVNSVRIANTFTKGTVNITTGTVSGGANKKNIIANKYPDDSNTYRAVVIPGQTITAGMDLIYVTTGKNQKTYKCTLASDVTFEPGKQYTFTLTIN
ncbi:hypothetical protein M2459_003224 [Parabacteroides sp. PF5-5]|uniref:fimbrillin family protein n=1 Tax=unclassified Parabacteroides TaxID=2649774 RepID=UPI002474741A|nr:MULTISPECIES: fimbrillin family protein [unclassified Parabacteroides]MDH6306520.1 hypothetical protein [Parabacteroides sp. PH5-39]MDH6317487.1 hypothetical protein [Parabacteroides sp. PF5-13]MDH6321210.1 hypothetical protein [Parabacteroides sp. PH5-13]MDH6324942.1 hypothetical protein [Parabacteroides sp. PH5-8]MDH6328651.1 hypothetical protein [Parabacteroides sp. PH5-41]